MNHRDPIPLEEPTAAALRPASDKRPLMPEPPPVQLVAVADVRLEASAGLEAELDAFYVKLLRFEREAGDEGELVYRAENARLRITVVEGRVERDHLKPFGVAVPLLLATEHGLVDREHDYVRQKGLLPGQESLLLQDPGGNWIEISESRAF